MKAALCHIWLTPPMLFWMNGRNTSDRMLALELAHHIQSIDTHTPPPVSRWSVSMWVWWEQQRALTCSSAHLTAKPSNRSQHVLQPAHHAQHDSLPPYTLHIVQSFAGRWITYTTLKHSTLKAGFKEPFKLRGKYFSGLYNLYVGGCLWVMADGGVGKTKEL